MTRRVLPVIAALCALACMHAPTVELRELAPPWSRSTRQARRRKLARRGGP